MYWLVQITGELQIRYCHGLEVSLGLFLDKPHSTKCIDSFPFLFRYKKTAMDLSAAFKHRPMPALQTGIFWTEYLLRHGPKVFDSPVKRMALWQREGLDVLLLLIILIVSIVTLPIVVIKFVFSKLSSIKTDSKKVKPTKSKKRKQN